LLTPLKLEAAERYARFPGEVQAFAAVDARFFGNCCRNTAELRVDVSDAAVPGEKVWQMRPISESKIRQLRCRAVSEVSPGTGELVGMHVTISGTL
jgi:hypothetical protein